MPFLVFSALAPLVLPASWIGFVAASANCQRSTELAPDRKSGAPVACSAQLDASASQPSSPQSSNASPCSAEKFKAAQECESKSPASARADSGASDSQQGSPQPVNTSSAAARRQGDNTQAPDKQPTLDTIVVTAEQGVPLTYTGGRDVIEPDTLQSYPDGFMGTPLRRVAGVYFLPENGNDSRINIGLRGNDPRRSALSSVLVDGIPVCEAPYGNTDVDGLPIAFERVWRTDVIRGGASVRYGPNSAGGIVNFSTEPVPDHGILRFGSRIGSDGDYAETLSLGNSWGQFGALFNGVVKGGAGYRENGEFQDLDGSLKLRYVLGPSDTLTAYASRFDEPDAEQPGGLSQAAYEADPDQSTRDGSNFVFDMNRYVLQYTHAVGPDSALELKTWFQEGTRQLNDFRPILPPFTVTRQQNSDFHSGALEASYSWRTDWLGLEHSFYHSARFLEEENDVLYIRTPIGGGPPITPHELDALFRGQSFSVFNEDTIALTPELRWALGFRVEFIDMWGKAHETGNEIVHDYSEFLPETNLSYRLLPETSLYASFQEGFYPPQYETGFDPASVLYAPTDPEHSNAYELGLRSREIEGLQGSLALFDTEFDDKIEFITTPEGKTPVNIGRARASGVELGFDYNLGVASSALDGLGIYGSLTCQKSKILAGDNKGKDTPNAPHWLASWGAHYTHEDSGLWGRIGGSYSGLSFKDLANTPVGSVDGVNGPQPAFTLWDLAFGWNQRPDRTGLALSAGITNLFDEAYFRRFSTGICPGAPQQAFAMISYSLSF